MDADKTRELLASDADVETVESAANSAKDAGIDGVPTFILGGVAAVTGAQSPEVLANAIEQIAVNREQFLAEQRRARERLARAARSASTRMALAAIHEPTMRAPMRCQCAPQPRRTLHQDQQHDGAPSAVPTASGWPRAARSPPAASSSASASADRGGEQRARRQRQRPGQRDQQSR